jgi:Protein of unknown function (DUF2934)
MSEMEQEIRERAYQIWEEQGRPHGREIENWLEAERSVRENHEAKRAEATGHDTLADDAEGKITRPTSCPNRS